MVQFQCARWFTTTREKEEPENTPFIPSFLPFLLKRFFDMTRFCINADERRRDRFFFFAFILISSGKLNWYSTCEIQEENAKNNAIDGLFSKCFSFISLNILLCLEIVFVFNCSGFAFLLNVSFCWRFQMNSNHFHWMVFFVHPKALIIFVFANKFMLPITFIVLLKKKRFYTFYIRTNWKE